jgi:hydrocephalus-inducing protein
LTLKASAVSDFAKYEVETREIYFKPTSMYTTMVHNFKLKNISLIHMKYYCKIIYYDEDNVPRVDPGYFYVTPKQGTLAPNTDE